MINIEWSHYDILIITLWISGEGGAKEEKAFIFGFKLKGRKKIEEGNNISPDPTGI